MRFGAALNAAILTVMATLPAAHAHPGHVHGSGPVHGFSWMDLLGVLVASVALPAAALLAGKWHDKRRRASRTG